MEAVLLDMDGVVVDSEPARQRYLQRFLAEKGVPVAPGDLQWYAGLNYHDAAGQLVRRYALDMDEATCEAQLQAYHRHFYLQAQELCPFPGLVDFLGEVRRRGGKTGLVSSTGCFGILSVLNRFSLLPKFDVVVGSEFVQHHKPDPEPYLAAATFLGLAPAGCVVVEDSPPGIEAGLRAGMHVVGFTAGGLPQNTGAAHETAQGYGQLMAALGRWFPAG